MDELEDFKLSELKNLIRENKIGSIAGDRETLITKIISSGIKYKKPKSRLGFYVYSYTIPIIVEKIDLSFKRKIRKKIIHMSHFPLKQSSTVRRRRRYRNRR